MSWLFPSEKLEESNSNRTSIVGFELYYDEFLIGKLSQERGFWKFEYSAWFKQQTKLRPITNFPDVQEVYHYEDLPPFFASRIPGLNRPSVRKKMQEEGIDKEDSAALLRMFGRRTITNPFVLYPV